ncbi:uncharacterized protein YbjQ (UPF0145 family) [Natronobacillus azotifigens]|uniref:UPF0145 protein OWO01_08000 n=1 Tax=Natronobacillus azotifigens TaxID=472978 RepID=A0A9J6RC80_9BACI|nr:YbjQ family protein [Natronobacillus azotifigens]MCZ0703151.1 YbjQ family protein [Natronobacillus azotifigens]
MIIVTTDFVPGKEIKEFKGLVRGSTVQSKHIGRDITSSFKTIVGGEIKAYTEMLDDARKKALERMTAEAESLGANAIIAMRLESSTVMGAASEIIAYGTAVTVE